jgi:hypothetical protein
MYKDVCKNPIYVLSKTYCRLNAQKHLKIPYCFMSPETQGELEHSFFIYFLTKLWFIKSQKNLELKHPLVQMSSCANG